MMAPEHHTITGGDAGARHQHSHLSLQGHIVHTVLDFDQLDSLESVASRDLFPLAQIPDREEIWPDTKDVPFICLLYSNARRQMGHSK